VVSRITSISRKVSPLGVQPFDKLQLPYPAPLLHPAFALEGRVTILMVLEPTRLETAYFAVKPLK